MSDYLSYHRPRVVIHTLLAGEVSSGIADITFVSNPQNTKEVGYVYKVEDVSGVVKTDGLKSDYNTTSGTVRIENSTETLATGDVVTIIGMKYS